MKFISDLRVGEVVNDIYLVRKKTVALTKAGKTYESLDLQDKTGNCDGKIWEPDSMGIDDYDALDYVFISGEVSEFQGKKQMNIKRLRKAKEGEYNPADYLPCSDYSVDEMYDELMQIINTIKAPYMKTLLLQFFGDKEFEKRFKFHSAAKAVHHGFVGGLLEHTLSVTKNCEFFAQRYPMLDRDLLLTAAMFHDVGKLDELSPYPQNDYTDDGQLLGHIMIGAMKVENAAVAIEGFPEIKRRELVHCILAHHGELEYGSPKKPALAEAIALSFADNIDAKLETMKEALNQSEANDLSWQGFNRMLDSNIRRTS
ncbi:MAG: HD domain-containing protein [Lachnospiraceae bacterium]|nr:HD domain-containing protein [Lachnospiraceae bacterium]